MASESPTEAVATAAISDPGSDSEVPASGLAAQHSPCLPTQHALPAHDLTTNSGALHHLSAEAASASHPVALPSTVAAISQFQSEPSVLQGHTADVTSQQAFSDAQHQPELSLTRDAARSQTGTSIKADTSALHDHTAVEYDEASSVSTASSIPEELDEAIEFFISQEPSTTSEEVPQPSAPPLALPSESVLQPGASVGDLPLDSVLEPGATANNLLSERAQPEAGASSSALLSEFMLQSGALISALPSNSGHLLSAAPASHLTEAVQDQETAHAEQHHAPALLALAEAALADADADAPGAAEQGINALTCFAKVCWLASKKQVNHEI